MRGVRRRRRRRWVESLGWWAERLPDRPVRFPAVGHTAAVTAGRAGSAARLPPMSAGARPRRAGRVGAPLAARRRRRGVRRRRRGRRPGHLSPPRPTEGRQIAGGRAGCAACHGADGRAALGPGMGRRRRAPRSTLDDGSTVTVDEAYLTRSIADPDAQVARRAIAIEMPQNQLTDEEIADVVAYIVALNGQGRGGRMRRAARRPVVAGRRPRGVRRRRSGAGRA